MDDNKLFYKNNHCHFYIYMFTDRITTPRKPISGIAKAESNPQKLGKHSHSAAIQREDHTMTHEIPQSIEVLGCCGEQASLETDNSYGLL